MISKIIDWRRGSNRTNDSLMVKATAKPAGSSGEPLHKTPVAGAFKLLVADMRRALEIKGSRKKLDAILVRADTERRAGTITEQEYHTFCSKWHTELVKLMKRSAT